ncbi:DUF4376 domain-containing protein [Methylobacterium soli]|uniref:DUF4376 domain-containing protein n=1 Tax=Methylobacterium soli TaxID=553447 RepID=A0A6L3T0F1_9HYPH|nr:DUF4376 domain-containing protein [Methylobacterium soli]KAB1079405.1 DUF4376 domain-containing protein [Methylobacterium soli]GJE45380.1 hypothetical protein AEGHOMDF_4574 [Methylobacterium soli]
MQLVVKPGVVDDVEYDLVIATHDDATTVPEGAYPGAIVVPFAGTTFDLERIGAAPADPSRDVRPMRAPSPDLAAYAAAVRYDREKGTVTVTIGKDKKVPLSIAREDRDGLRDTLLAISSGLRKDGDVFKFADGTPRAATNAEMQDAVTKAFGYVQALYNKESELLPLLGGQLKTYADVDAAFDAVKA